MFVACALLLFAFVTFDVGSNDGRMIAWCIERFFIAKAYTRPWVARIFLYRKNTDKHEFSKLLSPTIRELSCLSQCSARHIRFQIFLVDCRNKVGHHGKYNHKDPF